MQTLKILALGALAMFSRYDAGGGCVANFSQSATDMSADMGAGLQVTPARISVTAGAVLQVDGGASRAGQSVQLKQGSVALPLGVLDAQGHLQRTLGSTDLAALTLGPAQVTTPSGAQAPVRFFIEPRLENAPAPFAVGPVSKVGPTPVWVGIAQKKILTLNFRDATGNGLIRQSVGEYFFDKGDMIVVSQMQNYKSYSSPIFPSNYLDQGTKFQYISTGIGLTETSFFLAEYDATGPQAAFVTCPLDSGCNGMLTVRSFNRITSMCGAFDGTLFAAIITANGAPSMLRVFRDGTLGTAIDIVGASTALPHETMLGAGRLTEDEQPELIALSPTGTVSIWVGSRGALVASDSLTGAVQQVLGGLAVAAPSALGVGDLDGDGLDDLVVASNAQVVMLLNQGDGRFSGLVGPTAPAGLAPVTALAVGDVSVSGRGIADLVLASKDQHSIGAIENSATY